MKWVWVLVVSLVVMVLSIALFSFFMVKSSGGGVGVEVGEKALNIELIGVDGGFFSLEGQRGRVVIVDFMATWCLPCSYQVEVLKSLRETFAEGDVVIVSIDVDPKESSLALVDYKNMHGADWMFAFSPEYGVKYKVRAIPTILVIDGKGVIRFRHEGVVKLNRFKEVLSSLVGG